MRKQILNIVNIVLYVAGSIMLFYGFHILLPSLTNNMKEIHKTLAVFLTYSLPILVLIFNLSINDSLNKNYDKNFYIILLLGISIYSLVISAFSITQKNYGVTLLFPFDLIVISSSVIVYSIFLLIKKSNAYCREDISKSLKIKNVIMNLYISVSAYFLGQLICDFDYLFSSGLPLNRIEIIITFILFILMPIGLLLNCLLKNKNIIIQFTYTNIFVSIVISLFIAFLIILFIDPYIFEESLQCLMLVGMLAKFPLSILVIVVITVIYSAFVLYKQTFKFFKAQKMVKKKNEVDFSCMKDI